jgi:hypothetical protein
MYGDFLLLERDDQAPTRAERLAFGETSGRDEKWLRDTLFTHPELLPVRDIDPAYYPLIPLCRELRTAAGPLDVAYINPHGRLTLVECKLWRNPEARRKVVSQVLDYARAISDWSFSDLQRQVSASTGIKGNSPLELARSHEPSLVEHRFIDDVTKSIRGGKFLLIIAGDGIREDVAGLTDLINRNAASGFSFGLVEVVCTASRTAASWFSRAPLPRPALSREPSSWCESATVRLCWELMTCRASRFLRMCQIP